MPADACRLLHTLITGRLLRPETLDLMLRAPIWAMPSPDGLGPRTAMPWGSCPAIWTGWGGPGCVNAVYYVPDLTHPVTVAALADGTDEGGAEVAAARIAGSMPGSDPSLPGER